MPHHEERASDQHDGHGNLDEEDCAPILEGVEDPLHEHHRAEGDQPQRHGHQYLGDGNAGRS